MRSFRVSSFTRKLIVQMFSTDWSLNYLLIFGEFSIYSFAGNLSSRNILHNFSGTNFHNFLFFHQLPFFSLIIHQRIFLVTIIRTFRVSRFLDFNQRRSFDFSTEFCSEQNIFCFFRPNVIQLKSQIELFLMSLCFTIFISRTERILSRFSYEFFLCRKKYVF